MKRLLFPITVFFIMTTIGCTEQGKTGMTQGLNISDMDTTVSPGESFYQYATGGWQKANPIPDEYARYGSFDKLREENQHQIQALIQELSGQDYENGTNAQKVGDLYSIGMDSVKLNSDGAEPIRPLLQKIADVVSKEDIIRVSAQLSKVVSNPFFGFSVGPDDKNSSMNIVHIYQSGIGMGDRDYYLLQNEHSQNLRAAYIKLMETQFQNTGYSEADAKKAAANVMKIETELAGAHVTKEMRRLQELN